MQGGVGGLQLWLALLLSQDSAEAFLLNLPCPAWGDFSPFHSL